MAPPPSSEALDSIDQGQHQPQSQLQTSIQDASQNQNQSQQQQRTPVKSTPHSSNSSGGVNHSSLSAATGGFLATVRNAASKTTDILGIHSSSESSSADTGNDANGNNNSNNTTTATAATRAIGDDGSVGGLGIFHGNENCVNGTASTAALPTQNMPQNSHSAATMSAPTTSNTPAAPTASLTLAPPLPPSSLPSPSVSSASISPRPIPASVTNQSNNNTNNNTSSITSTFANATATQPTTATQDSSQAEPQNQQQQQQKAMDPSRSDLMTMEAFQMNGGTTLNNFDAQEFTGSSYMAGPGSFPETYGTNNQHYDENGEGASMYKSATQSMEGDDAYAANISFVYANEKRFSDFHALFRSVPDDEKLIEDYGCALQKEILVQGRLYISENHVCFNANIFGWVTNLVIAFSEITAIEKRLTAFVIPNAISIVTTTNTKGHFFASFLSRDAAHDLLMAAWRKSFPCPANASALSNNAYFRHNRSNLTLNEEDDDAASFISARPASDSRRNRHRRSSSASQNWTADEADWDETEEMDNKSTFGSRRRGSKRATVKKILKEVIAPILPDDSSHNEGRSGRARSLSELPARPSSFDYNRRESLGNKPVGVNDDPLPASRAQLGSESPERNRPNTAADPASNGDAKPAVFSGVDSSRSPTTCKCSKDGRHYANTFMTETYPGSVESMWKLLFESEFSKSFLTNEAMKGADVQEEPWQKAGDGTMTKMTKYTKWLGMPIGPKTTKAILTDVCENKNFDEYVTTVTTTSTPDVPSGGSFTTKCRTCITWAGPNQVQVVVTGAVEFTKSSWIKSQIEKGAAEGMTTHYKELNQSIRKHIAAHPNEFAGAESNAGATPSAVVANPTVDPDGKGRSAGVVRSRANGRNQKTNGEAGQEKATGDIADKDKVAAPAVANPEPAGKGAKAQGILSNIAGAFSGSDGDSASHLALVTVLLLVMFANIYIWFQISNVTSQIEKIQGDVFGQHLHRTSPNAMHKNSANNNPYMDLTGGASADEGYTREQEEAMWAWLTEREERHRQYQRASAQDWIRSRKVDDLSKEKKDGAGHDDADGTTFADFSMTEARLQARINELQQQLETLERALDMGAQGM